MNSFRGRGRGGFQGQGMGRGGGVGMGRGGGAGIPRQRRVEDKDQFKKLFIGGLSFETTADSLRKHFEEWGEITDCVVMKDPKTQKPKGFGFITYADETSVDDVQDKRPHTIDGREVDTKRAMPKEDAGKPECKESTKKIFLGGLKDDTTDDDVRNICGTFGALEKIEVIRDKETGKCRGFGFVTFTDTDKVDKIYLKGSVDINGRNVEVKKAVEKSKLNQGGGDAGGAGFGRGAGAAGTGMGGAGGMYGQPPQQPAYGGYGATTGYPPTGYSAQGGYPQQPAYGGGYGAAGMGAGYEGGYSAGPVRGGYQQQQRPSPYAAPVAGGYGAAAGGYGAAAGAYGAGAGAYGARRY